VFPFDRPAPPGAGDTQALAVNTTDGTSLYDVAFALVWADGDTVTNTNEAYALASCTGCQAVAVAFQVVVIVGDAHVAVPQNIAAAVNYNCVRCVTQALATQLVVTLSGPLSTRSTAELEALWAQIAQFGQSIRDVPLSQLQSRLDDYEQQILAILRKDPAWVEPSAGSTPSGTATTGAPTPTSTTGPTGATPSTGSGGSGTVTSTGPSPTGTATGTAPAPSGSTSPSSTSSSPPASTGTTASATSSPEASAAGDVVDATATPTP
jgi:putative peptide zinc metalloprotease protein